MKGNYQEICEYCAENEAEILLADGFEDALIGITEYGPGREQLAVYDRDKCVEVLMTRDGMTDEEAVEFFEFNTLGAWVGEKTPLFL